MTCFSTKTKPAAQYWKSSHALKGFLSNVKQNSELIAQLSLLGGKIEGSVFPMSQDGEAIEEIRNNWDSKYHYHFLGKTQ